MKLESLVIANQLRGDEYVPESCTQNSGTFHKNVNVSIKALGSIYIQKVKIFSSVVKTQQSVVER